MPRRLIAPDKYVMSDYRISIVLRVLEQTGRKVTRSNFHESRRRGLVHPASKGRGRSGDGYDAVAICQAALYFDLTQKVHLHQQTCSDIAYSDKCKQFLIEAVEFSKAAQEYVGGNANAVRELFFPRPEAKQMDIVFSWDLEWNISAEYLRGAEDLLRFEGKRRDSRMSLVVNVTALAWDIAAAIKEIE